MRPFALAIAATLLVGCPGSTGGDQPAGARSSDAVTSPAGSTGEGAPPSLEAEAFLPDPEAPIPGRPDELADALVMVTEALHDSIDHWMEEGESAGPAPRAVVLQALYQQRIYGMLARQPKLRARVLASLPGWLRGRARANAVAGSKLISLVTPITEPSEFLTGRPEPAGRLREWFEDAERRFGVDWELLAAVMYVESKFGRVRSASSAGAQGPMQFLPSTWAAYGMGGDIHDPRDAIMGAANYLRASGAPARERAALYAYNRSWEYVDAIQAYANQMRQDPRNYFMYYNWQVFVLTTKGPVRLTGPGL